MVADIVTAASALFAIVVRIATARAYKDFRARVSLTNSS
jgi:hypothetical protein